MHDIADEELLSSIGALVRQADELIQAIGVTVTGAPAPGYGSDRYQQAVHALDRLTRAEVQLAGRMTLWERTAVDGRNGAEIVRRLLDVKKRLQELGAGVPRPKSVTFALTA